MILNAEEQALLRKRGSEILDDIIAWRRTLHAMPELRMETIKTEAFIVKTLQELGVEEYRTGIGGHGVCAVIRGVLPGKCLAIRADCDGLPIREETGLPFASQNGNMHACGHDAHTAIALGAVKLLLEQRARLRGIVKFIFQPYEEGDRGASLMMEDGVLENPHVDAIIALHNHCAPDDSYRLGDVLVMDAPTSANIYAWEATFHGPGSHVCLSRKTPSPVYMACDAVSQIAALPEPVSETINAVTVINGGARNNIVPDSCTIAGSIRAFDTQLHRTMRNQVTEILQQAASRRNGSVEIKTTIDLMATQVDHALYTRFCETVDALYPERPSRPLKARDLIGEDFARYADRLPALYFFFHTRPDGSCYPMHNPKFDVDERVLDKASVLFTAFALNWQA